MDIKTCGILGRVEHLLGRCFNTMALIRTVGVIVFLMYSIFGG